MFEQRKTTVLKNKHSAMLSVKYVFLIWQETNGGIVILKTVLKSKLPPPSVKYVCPILHKTNHPNRIPKIVLKSLL